MYKNSNKTPEVGDIIIFDNRYYIVERATKHSEIEIGLEHNPIYRYSISGYGFNINSNKGMIRGESILVPYFQNLSINVLFYKRYCIEQLCMFLEVV